MAKLTEESESFFSLLEPSDWSSTSLADLRRRAENVAQQFKGDFPYTGNKQETVIMGNNLNVPVTILKPSDVSCRNIMVYFHGGGWTWSSRESHMSACEIISQLCNCVVINVEYRLAPENKIPACYEDAHVVVKWCLAQKEELSGYKESLVGVAGDSAGGNIAAVISQQVPGLDYQVLIYPSLTLVDSQRFPSYEKYSEGHLLTGELMTWFTNNFLNSEEHEEDAVTGSPLLEKSAAKLSQLPPTLLLAAECDPLADQSYEFKEKLKNVGVRTEIHLLSGTVHGFFNKPGHFKNTMKETIAVMNQFICSLSK